jgi:WD40 repeat protein
VTASSDHGLKVYDIQTGRMKRELFNKKYGHREWVTTVDHLEDGRILSGGQDSKLCLWDANVVRCIDLTDHKYVCI